MRPLAALVVTAGLLLGTACADDPQADDPPEGTTMDVQEAKAELQSALDAAAGAVAASGEVVVQSDRGPEQCSSDATGAVLDTVAAKVVLTVPVEAGTEAEALEDAVGAWDRAGLKVEPTGRDLPDPEVRARGADFSVRALAVIGSGQLALTGSTDCLEPGQG